MIRFSGFMALISVSVILVGDVQIKLKSVEIEKSETAETNLPGFRVYRTPPQNFDAYSASEPELRRFGLPARPDRSKQPEAYNLWEMLVEASRHRVIPGAAEGNIYHPPIKDFKAGKIPARVNGRIPPAPSTSSSWSAIVIADPNNVFNQPGTISGYFNVPASAYCAMSDTRQWSSNWVGVDGFNSSDVLQGGTSSDADCRSSIPGNHSLYYAWVEWYPNPPILLNERFPISPGDAMSVLILTDPTNNRYVVTIYDYTQRKSVSVPMSAPSGNSLIGSSIEWVIERPTVGAGLSDLATYTRSGWQALNRYAQGGASIYKPSLPPTGQTWIVTMIDTQGLALSTPTLYPGPNEDTAWFATPLPDTHGQ